MGSKKIPGTVRWDARAVLSPETIQIMKGFNARTVLTEMESLKTSIGNLGLKDALWVRPDYANEQQPYILIDGERRLTCLLELYREAVEAGREWDIKIPLQVFYVDAEGAEELMALALLERESPSFCDEAGLVARWLGRNFTVQDISAKLNRSTGWVEQRRTFTLLDPLVKEAVRDGKISVQAALDMARKTPLAKQPAVLVKVLAKAESCGQTRKLVAKCTGTPMRPGKRELAKVLAEVDKKPVNGRYMSISEVKRLVLAALRYSTGELASENFLQAYHGALAYHRTVNQDEKPKREAPETVINYLELK